MQCYGSRFCESVLGSKGFPENADVLYDQHAVYVCRAGIWRVLEFPRPHLGRLPYALRQHFTARGHHRHLHLSIKRGQRDLHLRLQAGGGLVRPFQRNIPGVCCFRGLHRISRTHLRATAHRIWLPAPSLSTRITREYGRARLFPRPCTPSRGRRKLSYGS